MLDSRVAASALILFTTFLPAQTAPPACFGFNMGPFTSWTLMEVDVGTPLTIYFTAPQTVTADQIVLVENTAFGASISVAVHAVDPANGTPASPPLSTAPGGPFFGGTGWVAKTLSAPTSFSSGAQYALVCTAVSTFPGSPGYFFGQVGLNGSTLLTFTGGGFSGSPPGTTQLGFRFGFQGPACGAQIAQVFSGGPPCGVGGGLIYPLLFPTTGASGCLRPALGQLFSLACSPNYQIPLTMPCGLFWSFGSNLAGTPISPLSPCSYHLDPISFASLTALGYEPLAVAYWNWGPPLFSMQVPNLPALIGMPIAMQAVFVDPTGFPSGFPGVNIQVSNSLILIPGL